MTDTAAPKVEASPLEAHIADWIADNPGTVPTLVAADLVEHGWYGATADIAERLEAVMERAAIAAEHVPTLAPAILARLVRELAEQLKAEVGA